MNVDVSTLMSPLRWLIEVVLVFSHSVLTSIGFSANAGITWLLTIFALLILLRLLVLPLTISATKNNQKMVLISLKKVNILKSYKSRKDAESKAQKKAELQAVKRNADANQLRSILPQLIQVPIFIALYSVLKNAQNDNAGVGPLTKQLASSFSDAKIFGVPFGSSLLHNRGVASTIVLGVILALILGTTQFIVQAVTLRYGTTDLDKQSPIWRFRPTPLFLAPPILIITSLAVPIGLQLYLAASSLWTLGQQLLLLRNYPLPTSQAHFLRQKRIENERKIRLSRTSLRL